MSFIYSLLYRRFKCTSLVLTVNLLRYKYSCKFSHVTINTLETANRRIMSLHISPSHFGTSKIPVISSSSVAFAELMDKALDVSIFSFNESNHPLGTIVRRSYSSMRAFKFGKYSFPFGNVFGETGKIVKGVFNCHVVS